MQSAAPWAIRRITVLNIGNDLGKLQGETRKLVVNKVNAHEQPARTSLQFATNFHPDFAVGPLRRCIRFLNVIGQQN
jgi:hypothetical protein